MASLFDTLFGSAKYGSNNTTSGSDQTQVQQTDQTSNSSGTTSTTGSQSTSQSGSTATAGSTQQQQSSTSSGVASGSTTQDAQTAQLAQTLQSALSTTTSGQTTTTLSQPVQDLLTGIVAHLATNVNSDQYSGRIQNMTDQLVSAAQKPAVSTEDIAGMQSAAKTNFDNNEAVDIGRLQSAIGSKNNTYSALVAQKGQTDLASVLGGITAQAGATNATAKLAALQAAIQGESAASTASAQPLMQLLSAIQALSGATTVTSGSSQTGQSGTTSSSQTGTSSQQGTSLNLTGQSETGLVNQLTSQLSKSDLTSLVSTIQDVLANQNSSTHSDQAGSASLRGFDNTSAKEQNSPGVIPALLSLFG